MLAKSFDQIEVYSGPVVVRNIEFTSHCEHHMVPFNGHARIGYLPQDRVVGLSRLARLVEVFARRLQLQERLTAQTAHGLASALQPRGVAVVIEAEHHCMSSRGVRKPGAKTVTAELCGVFQCDPQARAEILQQLRQH